jgi:hypothetical protein
MDPTLAAIPAGTLGARLRQARRARGLTQAAVARPEFTKSKSCPVGKTAKSNRVPPVVV